mgnify:CR=1 FL=1
MSKRKIYHINCLKAVKNSSQAFFQITNLNTNELDISPTLEKRYKTSSFLAYIKFQENVIFSRNCARHYSPEVEFCPQIEFFSMQRVWMWDYPRMIRQSTTGQDYCEISMHSISITMGRFIGGGRGLPNAYCGFQIENDIVFPLRLFRK